MLHLVTNYSTVDWVKRATKDGKSYLVAPLVLLREQVLHGSQGALMYPCSEIETNVQQWDNVPILLDHPIVDGQHVSSKHSGVIERTGLGFLRNSHATDGKLRAEGWFDVERTRRISPDILKSLEAGRPLQVSTGLFTDNQPVPDGSAFNGRRYSHIARNYVADHLAILTHGQTGACSVYDGCGVLVNHLPRSVSVPSFTKEKTTMLLSFLKPVSYEPVFNADEAPYPTEVDWAELSAERDTGRVEPVENRQPQPFESEGPVPPEDDWEAWSKQS